MFDALLLYHMWLLLQLTEPYVVGKFYTLTTGSNENRWDKMKSRLVEIVKSFQVSERFVG